MLVSEKNGTNDVNNKSDSNRSVAPWLESNTNWG